MGTNYYLKGKPPCECCGHEYSDLHIGKSSAGWAFSLHVIPGEIDNLEAWRSLWNSPGARIENEYGDTITPQEMEQTITGRSPDCRRDAIDGWHCIGNAEGTYDYIVGEFS